MGAALESSAPPSAKPSFKSRFKAWWEGYDLADAAGEAAPAEPLLSVGPPADVPAEEIPPLEHPHIKVAQQIWGEGFTRPGGTNAVLTLVKPFALNNTMAVMDFGAGLGGGTRAVAAEFDVWVTGFEPDPILAAGGQEISTKQGAKKAEVKPCAAKDFAPKQAGFDCIYSSEALYSYAEKDKLLTSFEYALKSRGQIALTDFVRSPGTAVDDPRLADFTTPTGQPGQFWSNDEYLAKMKGLKFDIRVDEDQSESYRSAIIEAWVNFTMDPAGKAYARAHSEALVAAVVYWTKRVEAIDSGAMQLRRYHAIKMGAGKAI